MDGSAIPRERETESNDSSAFLTQGTQRRDDCSAILKKWKLKMNKLDRTFPKWVFTNEENRQEV